MDVDRSSLCNCVVNFLIEENYLLTAFELLHELLDDGRDAQAIRLKELFSDPSQFPPEQISRFNSLKVADPQTLLEEKEALREKLAISEYELRLVQEDVLRLKAELQKSEHPFGEINGENGDVSVDHTTDLKQQPKDSAVSTLGPLKDNERKDLNFAVKEYLLLAGYRLTAMTFYEEVGDQNLDVWPNSSASVPDAMRRYYYQYLSSTEQAAEEKISMLQEIEAFSKENERINQDNLILVKNKELADGQITALSKSLESLQKDLKDKDIQLRKMKKLMQAQRQELNECRSEITSLQTHLEGSLSRTPLANKIDHRELQSPENNKEEIMSPLLNTEVLNAQDTITHIMDCSNGTMEAAPEEDECLNISEIKMSVCDPVDNEDSQPLAFQIDEHQKDLHAVLLKILNDDNSSQRAKVVGVLTEELPSTHLKTDNILPTASGLETIQILADALPKIVPYVLINHREELLPLIMCAIEYHPDSSTRDSLTHTLFNLIKRPDEQQRRIIMDACVSLAKNVGELRTETELLPQCWEQINHMYEERRLLVAQSCGELAQFVNPEIRDSLILSIVQQLVEDSATVVREAAAHNLALLLPLFPNTEKYFKVEELMFQLVCDPAGVVVDTTLSDIIPAIIKWGNKLDHILLALLSHMLGLVKRCPPLSGVEGSIESNLRILGERERWNIDVLLRMLIELVPYIYQKAIQTCPFPCASELEGTLISPSLLELYAGGHVEWCTFEWMHVECFPGLIQLVSCLPRKEDSIRNRITKFLLAVSKQYGDYYLTHIVLPVFLVSVGDEYDLTYLPSTIQPKIKGLRPKGSLAERLATLCVMPVLLAGVLGSPTKHEQLAEYLRKLLVQTTSTESRRSDSDIVDAVRFLCTFTEHHNLIFNIQWEMVVSSSINMKVCAANLLKVMVPYIDVKMASTQVLPALVTLGSDPNLNVKYASIDAFGSVAQHFKNDSIVDKIRVQMDAFLEDGSHEATIAVIRALVLHLLSKIFNLTGSPKPSTELMRRRERANAFCEAIRALDASDISTTSVREFLLPAIQNLVKDQDALDPAHKEALEIILKERSGGTLETFSKVMGMSAHLGIASSVSSIFSEGGLLGKKEAADQHLEELPSERPRPVLPQQPTPVSADDTRFRRIMRGGFTEMLRTKPKTNDSSS
ncbi:hypothetical protein V2J09_013306 [Rumex salicifolius]